jgi:hypothetical protein
MYPSIPLKIIVTAAINATPVAYMTNGISINIPFVILKV